MDMLQFTRLGEGLFIGAAPGNAQSRNVVIRSEEVHADDIWFAVPGTLILIVGIGTKMTLKRLLQQHGRPEINSRTATRELPNGVFSSATYTRLRKYLDL